MVALVYHPASDPYGSVLRSIQFLRAIDHPVTAEQIRVFDFLLLFPEFIKTFRLTTPLRSQLSKVQFRPRFRYEERPPAARLFSEMELSFEAALQTLKAKGIIRQADDVTGVLGLNGAAVPNGLGVLAAERSGESKALMDYLVELDASLPFNGPDGLKARTGLLEFRYDVV